MKSGLLRTTLLLSAITLAGALPSSMALAQASQGETAKDDEAAAKPASVGSVVIQAPRPQSKLQDIPPDKKAAFDEEAAKQEAWKRYRENTPPAADGVLGQAKGYPGLQSLLPQPDDAATAGPADVR